MSVSKKSITDLADAVAAHNARNLRIWGRNAGRVNFSTECIETLADFLQAANPLFDRVAWLSYVNAKQPEELRNEVWSIRREAR